MGTQGAGRKRLPNRERLTAEDDALNQIAREVSAGGRFCGGGGARSCQRLSVGPSVCGGCGAGPAGVSAGGARVQRPGDRRATLTPPPPRAPFSGCPLGARSWGAAPGARWPGPAGEGRAPRFVVPHHGVLQAGPWGPVDVPGGHVALKKWPGRCR